MVSGMDLQGRSGKIDGMASLRNKVPRGREADRWRQSRKQATIPPLRRSKKRCASGRDDKRKEREPESKEKSERKEKPKRARCIVPLREGSGESASLIGYKAAASAGFVSVRQQVRAVA